MVFGAGKIGGNFKLSVSNGGRFFLVSKPRLCWVKNGSWHCANRAVMLCWFGGKSDQNTSSKSKPKARITSHSSGPADAGRLTPALCKTDKIKT